MEAMAEMSDLSSLANRLMRSRRSTFTEQFVPGKRVPEETVRQILENANWAPTHKHTEPWRFIVFSGAGLEKLAKFQASVYRTHAGSQFRQEKYQKLLDAPLRCSHIIALCLKRSPEAVIPEIEEIAAVACAGENIYLSVTAFGLGGYWSTGGITYYPEAKAFLGLSDSDTVMGFFHLGYINIASTAGTRGPVEEKTTWINE
jgi:nitroreductase